MYDRIGLIAEAFHQPHHHQFCVGSTWHFQHRFPRRRHHCFARSWLSGAADRWVIWMGKSMVSGCQIFPTQANPLTDFRSRGMWRLFQETTALRNIPTWPNCGILLRRLPASASGGASSQVLCDPWITRLIPSPNIKHPLRNHIHAWFSREFPHN